MERPARRAASSVWSSRLWCCFCGWEVGARLLVLVALFQRIAICKSQLYQYGVPVPLGVSYLGKQPPLQGLTNTPFVYVMSGAQLPPPSRLNFATDGSLLKNPHHFIRHENLPKDQTEPIKEKNIAVLQDHHQCGVIEASFTRSSAPVAVRTGGEELRSGPESSVQSNLGENGTVLLTSMAFEGPDLSETAFYKHKGQNVLVSTKITYGLPTRDKEAPWQVAMFVKGKFHCGASIIGPKHILSAAHCVTAYKTNLKPLQLSLGDWDLETTTDGVNVNVEIRKIFTHPNFNFFNLQNDIAVLELTQNIEFNDRIRMICLPPPDLAAEGVPITVTGWGRDEKNLLQTRLHKLTAIVLENNICADRWSRSGAPRELIGSGTMCMDTQFGDSCKGDSGGPAVMEHPAGSGTYIQAGIVSFGSGSCTDVKLPGVYTRVAVFRDWIREQMI